MHTSRRDELNAPLIILCTNSIVRLILNTSICYPKESYRCLAWLCLMNGTSGMINRFRWADRDYIVSPKVIEDFVTAYLLGEHDSVCDEMQTRAELTHFVLYNAFCKASRNQSIFVARQYYREENWMLPIKPPWDASRRPTQRQQTKSWLVGLFSGFYVQMMCTQKIIVKYH